MVKSEEVPHADSAEVQSSLPPELPPQPLQTDSNMMATEQQAYQQPPVIHEQPKSFEKIVDSVQGRFNFIQDSEIDMDCKYCSTRKLCSKLFVANDCRYGRVWFSLTICILCRKLKDLSDSTKKIVVCVPQNCIKSHKIMLLVSP